jgi:GNAT superfamily N-acetyltransferase
LCINCLWIIIPSGDGQRVSVERQGREGRVKVKHLAEHIDVIPTLAAWVYDQWGHWMSPQATLETLVAKFEGRTVPGRIPETFVAMEGKVPLGTASLVAHDLPERMDLSPWLAAVYVAPEARSRGIGSALVRAVMDEALALGEEALYLFTPDKARFYSRLGWQVLEYGEHHGTDVTVMVYAFE